MKNFKKWRNLAGILILALLTAYIINKQLDLKQISQIITTIKPMYIFGAVGLMFTFWGLESLMIGMLLGHVDDKIAKKQIPWIAIKTTLVGQYYSNITPFASGGQPIQLMLLKKHNVSASNGTAILVGKFLVFQVTVTLYSLILSALNFRFIFNEMSLITGFLAIGLLINTIGLSLIIFMAFKPGWIEWITRNLNCILHKMNLIKSLERSNHKVAHFIKEYEVGIDKLKSDPVKTLKLFLLSIVQVTVFFGITFVIYKALNLSGISPMQVITLSAILYMCVSFVPVPGTVGASEVGFSLVLGAVFTTHFVGVAMILWRLVSYYFSLIFCGLFTLGVSVFEDKRAYELK